MAAADFLVFLFKVVTVSIDIPASQKKSINQPITRRQHLCFHKQNTWPPPACNILIYSQYLECMPICLFCQIITSISLITRLIQFQWHISFVCNHFNGLIWSTEVWIRSLLGQDVIRQRRRTRSSTRRDHARPNIPHFVRVCSFRNPPSFDSAGGSWSNLV